MQLKYDIVNDLILKIKFEMADVKDQNNVYTPERFQGKQLTTSAMLTFGF